MIKQNDIELQDYELENATSKDMCKVLLTEVVNQWKENIASVSNESRTREDIYCTVIREGITDYGSNGKITLVECRF